MKKARQAGREWEQAAVMPDLSYLGMVQEKT